VHEANALLKSARLLAQKPKFLAGYHKTPSWRSNKRSRRSLGCCCEFCSRMLQPLDIALLRTVMLRSLAPQPRTVRAIINLITGTALIGSLLAGAVPAYAENGNHSQLSAQEPRAPWAGLSDRASINCTKAGSTVAKILCGSHEGAAADWDLNATLWAFAGTLSEQQQKAFDRDQDHWSNLLNQTCLSSGGDISTEQQQCVLQGFHKRAAELRSRLKGDALAESKLSPEQHAQIQETLVTRGLLRSQVDGEFGSSTRESIKQFQGIEGAPQTGFLSSEQLSHLKVQSMVTAPTASAENSGVSCPGYFADPIVRQASVQVVAEMRGPNNRSVLNNLSEVGALNSIMNRIAELVYERSYVARREVSKPQNMSRAQLESCLPGLSLFMTDVRRGLEEKKRAAEAVAIEAAKPENQLFRGYKLYAFIKYCNEIRQGYEMVYINDVEMERARHKIEGIEKDALAAIDDKDFDTRALFNKAVRSNAGSFVNYQICHFQLAELFRVRSSTGGILIEKDF
jgi:uncharacterized protein YecT (DUF1311 family)